MSGSLHLDLKWSDPRDGIEVRVEGGHCGLSLAVNWLSLDGKLKRARVEERNREVGVPVWRCIFLAGC